MTSWQLNIGFKSNAQSLDVTTRQIKAFGLGFARLIVDDVAVSQSNALYEQARRTLAANVREIITEEIARMAQAIGRFFALPEKYTGPHGTMSVKGGMSETARSLGFRYADFMTMDRGSMGIRWAKRSPNYLAWKDRNGWPKDWWELTGQLSDDLSQPSLYTESFGPVQVTFVRNRHTLQKPNVTQSGLPYRPSQTEYQVGQLRVGVFNKITPSMLPFLLSAPKSQYGLAGLIKDEEVGPKLRTTPRGAATRYALEPFVSFYLNRSIPNAVWRRTERMISTDGFMRQKTSGRAGTEDFSQV